MILGIEKKENDFTVLPYDRGMLADYYFFGAFLGRGLRTGKPGRFDVLRMKLGVFD